MTIRELYEWAVENNVADYDIAVQYRDSGGFYYVDVEGRLTIPCSIFNIFDTEEQAKHVVDIFTKMGKEIFTYKEEMPL